MSYQLHLLRLPIRFSALARYSMDRGWIRHRLGDGRETDASFDAGRALHHLLDETFGANALKPFRLMMPRDRDRGTIYAYTSISKEALFERVAESAMPEGASGRILDLDQLDTKVMPAGWNRDKRLGFDIRVRPVVRIRHALPNPDSKQSPYQPGSEVDAYVLEAQRMHPEDRPRVIDGVATPSGMALAGRDRAAVYRDWLAARLNPAAELDAERTVMTAFQRTRVSRGSTSVEGPDATFHGELTITDPAAFHALLARGVGRHRSFGFGMLLLRPPRRR